MAMLEYKVNVKVFKDSNNRRPGDRVRHAPNGSNLKVVVTLYYMYTLEGEASDYCTVYTAHHDHPHTYISLGIVIISIRASMLSARIGRSAYTARYGSAGLSS